MFHSRQSGIVRAIEIYLCSDGIVPTRIHVHHKSLLCMPALELRLPHVAMSINEARGNDFSSAINDLCAVSRGWGDILANLSNDIVTDQDISIVQGNNVVIVVMAEHGTTLEENRGAVAARSHRCACFAKVLKDRHQGLT